MEIRLIVASVFLITFGLYFGAKIAEKSKQAQKIQGGKPAEYFHYAACSIFIGLVPTILVEVFVFRLGLQSVLIALLLVAVAFVCLCGYAYFELPAREKVKITEDSGWTAQDAKTSGL
jgi:uncharacterized protein YacL